MKYFASVYLSCCLFIAAGFCYADFEGGTSGQLVSPKVLNAGELPFVLTNDYNNSILNPTHERGYGPEGREGLDALKSRILPYIPNDPTATIDPNANTGGDVVYNLMNFPGTPQSGWTPADCDVAHGGPSSGYQVVVVINETIRVYRAGLNNGMLLSSTLQTWFNNVGAVPSIFDPKVFWDPWNSRWVLLGLGRNAAINESYYYVSVSQTNDATGLWWNYRLNAHVNGSINTLFWADYPGLAFNMSCVFITSNQYNNSNAFQYAKIRTLRKNQLYSGAALGWYDFWNMANGDASTAFTLKPAHMWTQPVADTSQYFINTKSGGWNSVTFWRINRPASNAMITLTRLYTVAVNVYAQIGRAHV